MPSNPSPSFEDLLAAYEWVNAGYPGENAAYVCRNTGRVFWDADATESEEDFPDDIEDGTKYLAAPDKHQLDLGRAPALRFVDRYLLAEYQTVVDFFRYRGAYQKFKALLQRNGVLEAWYQYETAEVENAIREWAAENSIPVAPSSGEI